MLKWMSHQIFDMLVTLYGNGLLSDISDFLQTINDATITVLSGSIIADGVAIFKGLSAVLIMLFFLLELLNEQQKEMLTLERLVVMLSKLLAVTVLILNIDTIVMGLINLSTIIFNSVKELAVNGENSFSIFGQTGPYEYADVKSDMEKALKANMTKALGMLLNFAIPWACSRLCYIVAYVVAIGRSVELVVRAIFAPIGVSQLFEDGTRSAGIKYLKKIAAVGLQLGAIAVVLYASSGLCNSLVSTFGGDYLTIDKDNIFEVLQSAHTWTMAAIQIGVVGVILKVQTICNDIVGV